MAEQAEPALAGYEAELAHAPQAEPVTTDTTFTDLSVAPFVFSMSVRNISFSNSYRTVIPIIRPAPSPMY
jgi:hypothetical protein